jgi:hypothetical protein
MNVFYAVLRLDYTIPLARVDRPDGLFGLPKGLWSFSIGPAF